MIRISPKAGRALRRGLAGALLLAVAAGCGGGKPKPAPAAQRHPPTDLPAPLLRLPVVFRNGPTGFSLTWDAAAGTPAMWLIWKSGKGPERALRVAGHAPPAGGRVRYRARLKGLPRGGGLAYRLCMKRDCRPGGGVFASEVLPLRPEGVSLLVFGGFGGGSPAQNSVARFAEKIRKGALTGGPPREARMSVFLGNLFPAGSDDSRQDAFFYKSFRNILASTSVHVVPGPEEISPDCGATAARRFALPGRYSAFQGGDALFLFLDSNRAADYERLAGRSGGGACARLCRRDPKSGRLSCARSDLRRADQIQRAWLVKTLARDKSRWRIVFMRHPLFSSGRREGFGSSAGKAGAQALQRKLFRIFRARRVDLVIASGDPLYERSNQVQDVDPDAGMHRLSGGALRRGRITFRQGEGPIFVVTGGAGAPAKTLANPLNIPVLNRLPGFDRVDPSLPWVGAGAVTPHLLHLQTGPERLVLTAWGPDGTLIDAVEILRSANRENRP